MTRSCINAFRVRLMPPPPPLQALVPMPARVEVCACHVYALLWVPMNENAISTGNFLNPRLFIREPIFD